MQVPVEMNANSAAATKRLAAALQEYLSAHPDALGMDREYTSALDGTLATSRASVDGWGDGTHRHSTHASLAPSAAPTQRAGTATTSVDSASVVDRRSSITTAADVVTASAAKAETSKPERLKAARSNKHTMFSEAKDLPEVPALVSPPLHEAADSQVHFTASTTGDAADGVASHAGKEEQSHEVPAASTLERKYSNHNDEMLASLARHGSHGHGAGVDTRKGGVDHQQPDGDVSPAAAAPAADGDSGNDTLATSLQPQAPSEPEAVPAQQHVEGNAAAAESAPKQQPSEKDLPGQHAAANADMDTAAAQDTHALAVAHWHTAKDDLEHAGLLHMDPGSTGTAAAGTGIGIGNSAVKPSDPVRAAVAKSNWDTIPISDVGKLLVALAHAPPPPVARPRPGSATAIRRAGTAAAPDGRAVDADTNLGTIDESGAAAESEAEAKAAAGTGIGSLRRPQTKARFQRVMQQTAAAMALLEKHAAANGKQGTSAAAAKPPGSLTPPPPAATTSSKVPVRPANS